MPHVSPMEDLYDEFLRLKKEDLFDMNHVPGTETRTEAFCARIADEYGESLLQYVLENYGFDAYEEVAHLMWPGKKILQLLVAGMYG